jgi:nitrite reductase/ring-hydroxylating ferredoxin subunit
MRWIKIFKSWEDLCEKIPENDPYQVRIGEKAITVVRRNDRLHAFEALCPHQHEPLYKGTVNDFGEIICPLHAYRFNINTGREYNERCRDMITYTVKREKEVYIGLEEND